MIPKSRKIAFMAVMAVLTLAALACALTAPTAAQVGADLPTPTATAAQIATERPTAAKAPEPVHCTVTAANLHLRAGAGAESLVIGYLAQGDTLTIATLPALGNWQYVTTSTGAAGWVNMQYCKRD